jgi:hypothetical protein
MESEDLECSTKKCSLLADYYCENCEAHYCFLCARVKCKEHLKKGKFIDVPRFREQLERWGVEKRSLK